MTGSKLPRKAVGAAGDGIGRGRIGRAAPLLGLTAWTVGEAAAAGLRGNLSDTEKAAFHARAAERYAELLGRSKGALMKAGQMLSFTTIASAVPADLQAIYQSALVRLRSDVPAMPQETVCAVIESELGRTVEDIFAAFDWSPLAAASIGQVHEARLHDGRAVAVKVQYPGAADAIAADLKNAELLATFLSLIVGGMSSRKLRFDIRGAAFEMGLRIREELDYLREAANQAEFAEYYRGHPSIRVPQVLAELCTGRVLTQDLVRGLSWDEALLARQGLRDQWGEAIWRFTYGTLRHICLVNADPHPGNYLFHEDGSVSFLDFGCVKRFRREQVQAIDAVVRESLRDDALGTWRACVEAGFWRSTDSVTPDEMLAFWRRDWEMLWERERFVVTPEKVARRIERRCSPNGPSANALRHLTMSPEYTMMGRIEIGVESLIAQMGAGSRWGTIAAEYLENAPPVTTMGKRALQFFEQRRGDEVERGPG